MIWIQNELQNNSAVIPQICWNVQSFNCWRRITCQVFGIKYCQLYESVRRKTVYNVILSYFNNCNHKFWLWIYNYRKIEEWSEYGFSIDHLITNRYYTAPIKIHGQRKDYKRIVTNSGQYEAYIIILTTRDKVSLFKSKI